MSDVIEKTGKGCKGMVKKIAYLLFFTFVGFSFCASAQSKVEELFEKTKIQPLNQLQRAPELRLENLEGKTIQLRGLKGKVVLLNFWATWCSPCKEEMPSMESLYQRFDRKDFTLLAVSVDFEEKEKVKGFVENKGYTFPVLLDPKGRTLDLYKVRAIPTTFIIDKRGLILGKAIGPRKWDRPEVITMVQILIEKR